MTGTGLPPVAFPNLGTAFVDPKTGNLTSTGRALLQNLLAASGTSTAVFVTPQNFTAVTSGAGIQLAWSRGSDPSILSWTPYRSADGVFANATALHPVTAASYNDSAVTVGATYTYWLTANRNGSSSTPAGPVSAVAGGGGGGGITSLSLEQLTDARISNPKTNDLLTYIAGTWRNENPLVISGVGVPTVFAAYGVIYERMDPTVDALDRTYVSNGTYPYLAAQQIADGALHQYLLNDITGTACVDTVAGANGTYVSPFTLAQATSFSGDPVGVLLGSGGYIELPFNDFPHGPEGQFSIVFCTIFGQSPPGGTTHLFCNGNPPSTNSGMLFYSGSSTTPSGFAMGTAGGFSEVQLLSEPSGYNLVGVTFDGTALSIYINGVLQNSTSVSGAYIPGTHNFYIGSDPADGFVTGPNAYSGVAVYSKCLTPFQMGVEYSCATGAPYWSDIQAVTVRDGGDNLLGFANTVAPGANVAFLLAGENLVISTPGVSFSGTNITDIEPGPGWAGTVAGGTLHPTNTGVLSLNKGTVSVSGSITLGTNLSLAGQVLNASGGVLTIEDSFGHTIVSPATIDFLNGTVGGNSTVATYTAPSGGAGGALSLAATGTFTSVADFAITGLDTINNDYILKLESANTGSNWYLTITPGTVGASPSYATANGYSNVSGANSWSDSNVGAARFAYNAVIASLEITTGNSGASLLAAVNAGGYETHGTCDFFQTFVIGSLLVSTTNGLMTGTYRLYALSKT